MRRVGQAVKVFKLRWERRRGDAAEVSRIGGRFGWAARLSVLHVGGSLISLDQDSHRGGSLGRANTLEHAMRFDTTIKTTLCLC